MDLIVISTCNWVGSAHDKDYWKALENAALNLWVPLAIELLSVSSENDIFLT